jgi:hypothetical protein
MRSPARCSLLALLLAGAIMAVFASSALAAPEFGVESFYAANCKIKTCEKAGTFAEEAAQVYGQAAGHPPFGVTDFTLKSHAVAPGPLAPNQNLKSLRIDGAPGVSTNPEAVKKCPVEGPHPLEEENFTGKELEPAPGIHAFTAPICPGSEIGENVVTTALEVAPGVVVDFKLNGKVYNLEQPNGDSSYFGVALNAEPILGVPLYFHTFIIGHVEWASDYHDFFQIENITPGLLSSRLMFYGNIGTGGFLSNPSNCAGPGPLTTTAWHGTSYEGASASSSYTVPLGTEGCNGQLPFALAPFAPTFSLAPETTQSDRPDGITTELALPHNPNPAELDSAQLRTASVVLPEGMTLNPSAAHGLETCTPAQIGIHTTAPVTCPAASKVASAILDVPGLPPSSLEGNLYLGGPAGEPITKPPFTVYLDVESARYGISVRLKGEVTPNESTGQLTATFNENPEQPFSDLILKFNGGALAPIANPLVCGPATANTVLTPFTGTPAAVTPSSVPFTVDSNGAGGGCPSPLPFSLSQSTTIQPATGGSASSFTLNLGRGEGQQYLSSVSATLPPGLIGLIPKVKLCEEPYAAAGSCSAASEIGSATVQTGAGPTPTRFSGPAYLTGPYNGAPYGMTFVVPAVAGPFNLGNVVSRVGININPYTARVTVSGNVPTIVKGIPLRLRTLSIAINRQGFLQNPTNCGVLATETLLGSTFAASQSISTPFQVSNCTALAFKPKFTASANAGSSSKKNGIALGVKIAYTAGPQANIRSVKVTLPKQLPSRLTTLQKACTEKTFNSSPWNCPASSRVGGATVYTPALPAKLTGPAFFVSHGGQAFPDLDLDLTGNGVEVILVGNTNISKGITTSTFAAVPDVPVSSFELNLPTGTNSALTANGVDLCGQTLSMPTVITAQSGTVINQSTALTLTGCKVRVGSHKASGHSAVLTVNAPAAGRVSGSGPNLKTVYVYARKGGKIKLKVPLTGNGVNVLNRNHTLTVKVRVGFIPVKKGPSSSTHAKVTFRG